MTRLDADARDFYATLAARAEAEDYCPIELVTVLPSGTSTTAEELDSLVRELRADVDDAPMTRSNRELEK